MDLLVADEAREAVGVGVDVTKLDKDTTAYIDSGVTATADGDIDVTALVSEDITSVAEGLTVSGSVAVTADVSVHVITNHTRAFIGDDVGGLASLGAGDVSWRVVMTGRYGPPDRFAMVRSSA